MQINDREKKADTGQYRYIDTSLTKNIKKIQ